MSSTGASASKKGPRGDEGAATALYKSPVSLAQVSLAQDNDDDMDPISESLLSSGTRRRVMLSSTNPFDDDEGSTAEIVDPVQSNDEAPNALKSSTAARTEAQYAAGRKAFECVPTPLPDVQATPLRSMIQKQYPAFRIPEEDEYSQYGQGREAIDGNGARSTAVDVAPTQLRSTTRR